MQQLLWLETLLKLSGGLALVLAPISSIKLLGLAPAGNAFWPRLLGAVLIGLAGATVIEGRFAASSGLGLAGCVVINLTGAAMVASLLLLDAAAPSRRGKAALWGLVAALVILSLLEIAYI